MALVGHLRGGLAHVNVVVGMFISGISGSSTADAAAIGSVFHPAMTKRGYDERFAVCLTACTATMGAVIPPSILMVIYGATAGVSIGALLIGGILPGILMGSRSVQSHFAVKHNFPREHPRFLGMRAVWNGLKAAGWPLGVPVIIVVGMVGGCSRPPSRRRSRRCTPLVTLFILRTLRLGQLPKLFSETAIQFAQVMFCLGGASIFGWLLAYYQVPDMVTKFITSFTRDWLVIMLLIVLVNVVLGTFMDALPAILIFVPIIHPLAVDVGIHPVHLGVVVVMTQSFGLLTPPLGMVAMTACAVAGVPMMRIQKLLHLMMIPPHRDRSMRADAMERIAPSQTPRPEMGMTSIAELETPAVTIDVAVMEDNAPHPGAHLDRHGIAARPHIKTHKIPALGKLQMKAGAAGITCQKLGEVEVRRCRRGGRRASHLQHPRPPEDRAPDGASEAPQAPRGCARQRGGRQRTVRRRPAPRHYGALSHRVRHRHGAQRRADAAGRARSRARGHEAAAHGVRGHHDFFRCAHRAQA